MAEALTIWLYEQAIAHIERIRGRLRLTYTETALREYSLGVPLLSVELPVGRSSFPSGIVGSFLEGLLPEGDALLVVADELGLRPRDTYALISALGRDCAGALVIQPEHEPAPHMPNVHAAERLTDGELVRLIDNLRSAPLGIDQRVRLSLGGAQEKLLLTQISENIWGRPVDGTPSTHIFKPQIRGFDHSVENEAFCMRLAAHTGLPVASIETLNMLERPLLVVERYDRTVTTDGTVERIHQEDLCQALGLSPRKKYEEDGGPSLRRVARVMQTVVSEDDMATFLRTVVLNVVLGNGDAHGKNFSLLHERSGKIRLAPLYDLLCTLVYSHDRLAMYIDTIQRIDRVTAERIVNEATLWGFSRRRANDIVAEFLDRIPAAIDRATQETAGVPQQVINCVLSQLERVRDH